MEIPEVFHGFNLLDFFFVGGALVAARRLHNWGAQVQVILAHTAEKMTEVPAHQLEILMRMGVDCSVGPDIPPSGNTPQLIIDGLIGYSLKDAPYGVTRKLIEWSNANGAPVLALDTPSGVDTTTGTIFEPTVKAAATMTLALPKQGLRATGAAAYVGELYLADISVPPALYNDLFPGFDVGSIFATSEIVRL